MNRSFLLQCSGSLLIALFFFVRSVPHVQNVPIADDYDLFLHTANQYLQETSLQKRLFLVTAPHNEHRPLLLRVAALGSYFLLGAVSLPVFLYTVQLLLLLSFLLLLYGSQQRSMSIGIAAALLFFQPQYGAVVVWSSAGVSVGLLVFCAVVACVLGWRAHPLAQAAGLLAAVAACLANAGGFAVAPAIAATAFLNRRWKIAGCWFVFSILLAVTLLPARPGNGIHLSLGAFEYCLALFGSAAGFGLYWPALIAGVLVACVSVVLTAFRTYERQPFVYSVVVCLLGICAITAVGRAEMGIPTALATSRYRLFSTLLLVSVLLLGSELLRKLSSKPRAVCSLLILGIAGCFSIVSYRLFEAELSFRSPLQQQSIIRWQLAGRGLLHPAPAHAAAILQTSERLGTYQPPVFPVEIIHPVQQDMPQPLERNGVEAALEHLFVQDKVIYASGWAFVRGKSSEQRSRYLAFISEQNVYLVELSSVQRLDVARHFKKTARSYADDQSGFAVVVDCSAMPRGRYLVRILLQEDGSWRYRPLSKIPDLQCRS